MISDEDVRRTATRGGKISIEARSFRSFLRWFSNSHLQPSLPSPPFAHLPSPLLSLHTRYHPNQLLSLPRQTLPLDLPPVSRAPDLTFPTSLPSAVPSSPPLHLPPMSSTTTSRPNGAVSKSPYAGKRALSLSLSPAETLALSKEGGATPGVHPLRLRSVQLLTPSGSSNQALNTTGVAHELIRSGSGPRSSSVLPER